MGVFKGRGIDFPRKSQPFLFWFNLLFIAAFLPLIFLFAALAFGQFIFEYFMG